MQTFIFYAEDIKERLDPQYLINSKDINNLDSSFPIKKISDLLIEPPQYGANERAVEKKTDQDIRYIRITDIDEYGNLKNDDWKTAENVEKKYLLQIGDILFARSGATAGKTFIYKKSHEPAIFAGYLIKFKFDISKVMPSYIFYFTQLSIYQKWVKSIQRPSGQPNINSEEFKSLQLPIPSLDIQEQIVKLLDNAYEQKHQKEQEAQELLNSIDTYVMSELDIELLEVEHKKTFIVNIDDFKNKRIDPHYYLPEYKQLLLSLNKLDAEPLGDLIKFSNQLWDQRSIYRDDFPYIEISQVDTNTGELKNCERIKVSEAPSRAKMIVKANDILISTTRPNRGAIALVNQDCDNYIASTGFAVLRDIKKDFVSKEYLFYILRTKFILNQMLQRSSGGNYPAITIEELKNVLVPIPQKTIQNKVVQEVEVRMKRAKILKQEAIESLDNTKKAVEKMILGS